MDDLQIIQYLGRALSQAASQRDWPQVQEVDKQIAALLSALQGKPLADEKRAALKSLQQIHHQVNKLCQQQSDELERKMALGRRNREGAVAYAAFMDDEDLR
ncbi:flagellar protein FliT [Enterobacteriaceae bacterium H20N1]|uniref:Flagellar protein FliT n=1 Tax=Dryocola boscaweniae TaxID=2925397 RepID=A0A9X2W507_9ENTR|nr:flagellar protein FliT [Dryocola boscaweniae]MCT4700666.1 flagellar protein FliT [Dryocola boscaweniae]MCT4717920.1 flagellar protein FliT [Dryocola boscaweniae]